MIAKFINPTRLFNCMQRETLSSMRERKQSLWPLNGNRFETQAVKKSTDSLPEAASEIQASEIRKTIKGPVVTFEGTYQGKPIRVRIFNEPTQKSD
jgi:hypothetical protein